MEAADPLDRDNLSTPQPLARLSKYSGIVSRPVDRSFEAVGVFEPEPRATTRTGDVLGMKPSVRWALVFCQTLGAGGKNRHRRPIAVERGRKELCESGAAIGAARECI